MAAHDKLGNRRIDRILAKDYLAGLRTCSIAELRLLRRAAEQEEVDVSYLRRLLQGRVDVLRAEQARRAGEVDDLVASLAQILAADGPRRPPPGLGRHSTLEPSRVSNRRRFVEALVADVSLSDVAELEDAEIAEALAILLVEERGLSKLRRDVQDVMDVLSAEVTRRYREGEAVVDALLAPAVPGLPTRAEP